MADKVDERALEALLSGCKTPQDVAALYTQMLQRVIDRGLSAELDAEPAPPRRTPESDTCIVFWRFSCHNAFPDDTTRMTSRHRPLLYRSR